MKFVSSLASLMIIFTAQLDALLTIQTADKNEFIFNEGQEKEALLLSITLKHMLADIDEYNDDEPIPLPDISTETFNKVRGHLIWLLEYNNLEGKDKEEKKEAIIYNLAQYTLEDLSDFIQAVNFLNIPDLLYFSCLAWSKTYELACFENDTNPLSNPGIMDILKEIRLIPLIDFYSKTTLEENFPFTLKHIFQHDEVIKNFCVSGDGNKIACITENEICIWDLRKNKCIKRNLSDFFYGAKGRIIDFHPHKDLVCFALAVKRDNDANKLNFVAFWNLENPHLFSSISTKKLDEDIFEVCYDRIGENVALGGRTKIHIFNTSNEKYFQELGGQFLALDLNYSHDNTKLACCSADGKIYVWELATSALYQKLQTKGPVAESIRYSPNGELIATGYRNGTIRLWDAHTAECLYELQKHTFSPNALINVAFRPDGKVLASASTELCFWNVATGECIGQRSATNPSSLKSFISSLLIAYKPGESNYLICTPDKNTIKIWDLNGPAALETSEYETVGLFHALCKEKKEKNAVLDLTNTKLNNIFNNLGKKNQDLLYRILEIKRAKT